MLGKIGYLLVKCMGQVTKGHFVPSVGGIGLLCNASPEGPVSFVKRLQRLPTG